MRCFGVFNYTSTCLVFDDTPKGCLDTPLGVKYTLLNKYMCAQGKGLSINPMYLNVDVLFISECLQHCFILENLFQ